MKLEEIRTRFLKYFEKNGHTIVPSSSLIPQNDPTLLFTNAGMNQFKDVFLGLEKRPYTRACSSQKCFRASGKHNDLENVGYTARHHTFFEMLGNFSFGDYFKKEAIFYAWEFLTKELGLDKSRLYITIYKDDEEAFQLWQEVAGVAPERIYRLGEKDNFWSMGEVGPCGPCSEIIYDQGEEVGCKKPTCQPGCDCDRYLELWNLVFMQYNRDEQGNLTSLPKPSIDTGMGLERITAVMQGVHSNYEIDHFRAIISKIEELTGYQYHQEEQKDISMRVIADHARAVSFLISDGILPGNEGRGYVLRRVMRRASRHARLLGKEEPILYLVAERVIDLMAEAYPELEERRAYILEVIRNEEERFLQTLESGLKLIQQEIEKHKGEETPWTLPGEVAFRLYDTYGFPLDLTQAICRDEGFVVDLEGFEREMEKQRERARAHWKGSGDQEIEAIYKQLRAEGIKSEFSGYEKLKDRSQVLALVEQGKAVKRVEGKGKKFQLIAKRTPFYGESGGQVGDQGWIKGEDFQAKVLDTQKPLEDLIVHHCQLEQGAVQVGDEVELEVDQERRWDLARNHSATHLLQASLRAVLGEHIQQKGSLVAPDRLRFDFTHFSPLTSEELEEVEQRVNQLIRANLEIRIEYLPYQEALKRGAIALFGEKYGEVVRLVEMGEVSRELCGGTHCWRTGDIGFFKIISEGSVSAGVRRIEALTGRGAVEYVQSRERILMKSAQLLKTSPEEFEQRLEKLISENKQLRQKLRQVELFGAGPKPEQLLAQAKEFDGIKVLSTEVEFANPKAMLDFSDQLLPRLGKGVLVLGSKDGGKVYLLVRVSKDLSKKLNASKLVSTLARIVGGKGGGRADLAQGGGTQPENLQQALNQAYQMIEELLKK